MPWEMFLQEIYGVAFPLGKHGDQNVCAGHFLAARGLNVNCRALQHALKARGRFGILAVSGDEIGEFVVDVIQNLATEALELDTAGAQYGDRILIFGQRQQQMFERSIFVPAFIGVGQGPVQRLFEIAR
jgi:hypothetical protein